MTDRQGQTTLFYAAELGRAEMVDVVDEKAKTAILAAKGDAVALLQRAGATRN